MNDIEPAAASSLDLARRPSTIFIWWGLPILIGFGANFLRPSLEQEALLWSALFVWMATGCLLNARRCHRLHCYFSGPILLLGALTSAALGGGVLSFGPGALNYIVWMTTGLALLTFVPELIWGKYLRVRASS